MAVIRNTNVQVLKNPGAIFNAKITTEEVNLQNAQAAHFYITSGAGARVNGKAQIYAKRVGTDKEPVLVREFEVSIGENQKTEIVIAARELCHDEKNSAYMVIPNLGSASIVGSIFVILTNERYSTEPARG